MNVQFKGRLDGSIAEIKNILDKMRYNLIDFSLETVKINQ